MLKRKSLKQKPCKAGYEPLSTGTLVALILLLMNLIGCAKTTKLYPIKDTDIYFQPDGKVCFSQYYMEEVLKAKVIE